MERRSSRVMLWVLAVVVGIIVVAGTTVTLYTIAETSDARQQRCLDVVTERLGDRLLWEAIFESFDGAEAIVTLRQIVDEFKPLLECNRNDIPIEVRTNQGGP